MISKLNLRHRVLAALAALVDAIDPPELRVSIELVSSVLDCVIWDLDLPVAVQWGDAAVPAGRYRLVVPSRRPMVYLQGVDDDALIVAASVDVQPRAGASELLIAPVTGAYRVLSLELPGLSFQFAHAHGTK
jgi:hypothetical protein